jgi:hypothetical protein
MRFRAVENRSVRVPGLLCLPLGLGRERLGSQDEDQSAEQQDRMVSN